MSCPICQWVRGYGLIDSPKVDADPGKQLNLTAVVAPNDAAAAQYYPAIYWYSMLKIPAPEQFGGQGDIPENVKLTDWLSLMKNNGCVSCHQLGGLATRTIPAAFGNLGSSEAAWARRIQSGQAGELMVNILAGQLAGHRSNIWRIGPTASPRANCRRSSRSVRRASSATSW